MQHNVVKGELVLAYAQQRSSSTCTKSKSITTKTRKKNRVVTSNREARNENKRKVCRVHISKELFMEFPKAVNTCNKEK
jgi:hypothetical protein